VSSACRKALEAILRICHRVAVTSDIREEWNRHESRFSRKWRRSMAARRKPVCEVLPKRVELDTAGLTARERASVEKDRRLIEAALSADRIIVTRDDALRGTLAKSPGNARVLGSIIWINPVSDGVEAFERV
jgi:rRNA-processing protein FCF1